EKEASDRVAAYKKKAEARLHVATLRVKSMAALALSTARTHAKSQVIAMVKRKAMDALEQVAGKPEYGRVLEALAEEAMKAVETPEAVILHPQDEMKLRAWATQRGLELRADPRLHLGVRIVARGGQRSVVNSLPERLNRAWEALASDMARRLWG
ncbi:MAG TPA: V-type ATP synthase subunit E, partial [Candidatus Methylomirabilis sp.]|nr:V-type ATP synthase subunit E [Candidatus Methylomirabilis sp.]